MRKKRMEKFSGLVNGSYGLWDSSPRDGIRDRGSGGCGPWRYEGEMGEERGELVLGCEEVGMAVMGELVFLGKSCRHAHSC
ncbi:hypothetical protein ACFX1Z_004799 [Malus domestica]